ncbi:hypothetical protein K3495_g3280 [Podosphaera aphanis]|nr:hypothetical protein K3495_g3280 [Podosphaera aphanis]
MEIKKRAGGIIRNDLTTNNGNNCPSMCIIFARGTTEPGNVGLVAGPPFFDAMAKSVSDLAVQGVDYPASVPGFLVGGSPQGIATMADLAKKSLTDCPDTKLVLSGYSQGAQVVHKAADSLPPDMASKVKAVVLFGDPLKGTSFKSIDQSKVQTICKPDDDICKGGTLILPAHLSYGQDANEAAKFVMDKST